jgi:hypothetical protein
MRTLLIASVLWVAAAPCSLAAAPGDRTIVVGVDPRIELLSTIQMLSGYGERTNLITRFDVLYKTEAADRFSAFKDHRAVKLFDVMSRQGFSFDGPVNAALHLDGPPDFALRAEPSDYVCKRAGSREKLLDFFEAMREFYRESDFQQFLDEHAGFYDSCSSATRDTMRGITIATLEDYYGLRKHEYHIVLAPLLHPGGFGPQIALPDGSLEIFSVNGPQGAVDGRPIFGDEDDLRYLVWHEFSHSFMNPLAERHPEIVARTRALHQPLARAMKRQAYGDWETCVKEHLVRAATVRFAFRELGEEAGQKALEQEESRSFVYAAALADRLKLYEQQRDRYPTIDDFATQLLAVFDEALANAPQIAADAKDGPLAPPPMVVRTVPESGSADVDPTIAELRVEFDQDMSPGGYSWVQDLDRGEFPEATGKAYWVSPRICALPVKLKPGVKYWIGFNVGRFKSFRSDAGSVADEAELSFTTVRMSRVPDGDGP